MQLIQFVIFFVLLDRRRAEQTRQVHLRNLGRALRLRHEKGQDVHRQSSNEGDHSGTHD